MKRISLVLIALGLLGVAVGVAYAWPFHPQETLLRLPGVVETQEVRLGSKIGGRVDEVFVVEGQRVKAGEKILRIEVPELKAQRQQIEARLAMARAEEKKAIDG